MKFKKLFVVSAMVGIFGSTFFGGVTMAADKTAIHFDAETQKMREIELAEVAATEADQ